MQTNGRRPGAALVWALLCSTAALGTLGCMERPVVPSFTPTAPDVSRFVLVTGVGRFSVDPNQALVDLVVEVEGTTAKVAAAQGQQRLTGLKLALESVGIKRPEIEALDYGLEEVWAESEGRLRKSYRMRQVIRVSVRDLVKLPETLDVAVQNGADAIASVTFGFTNTSILYERARERALADARSKADLLAQESQQLLGSVLNIVEEPTESGGLLGKGFGDGDASYAFEVTLTVTYALSDFGGARR